MKRWFAVFERWRATRSAAHQWLLVRPGNEPLQPWQWRRLPGDEQGDWPPPSVSPRDSVALIMPARHCSHFQLQAPPGLKAHEWPQLLEESLQAPVEQVQISCLSRINGHLELLVVERALVQRWLTECAVLGVSPSHLWAEMQLLPPQAPGQLLCWSRVQDCCLIRGEANGLQQWLTWPKALGDLPEGWQRPADEMAGHWPSRWAILNRLPNLLPGTGSRRRRNSSRSAITMSHTQRRLVFACAALALCWGALVLGQFWQQVPVWKSRVEAVTGPVANAGQAARVLSRLQAAEADWRVRQQQMVDLEQAVQRWLETRQDWGVSGSYFDGQSWKLVLNGLASPPAAAHWEAMASASGARVKVEPSDNGSLLTLHFNLDAQP